MSHSVSRRRTLRDVWALRPSGAAFAGAATLALAIGAGWWLGGASHESAPPTAAPSVVAIGEMKVELESAWVPASATRGLAVEGAEVFAPAPGLAARAVLVSGPAVDASLVPSSLRPNLPTVLPAPRRATLAGLAAWTYGPLVDGGRSLEVTVAPTTAGTLAIVCSAPPSGWSAWVDCGNGVLGIDTGSAKALAPAPDLAFRQVAGPVLERLDSQRVAGRERLAEAPRAAPAAGLARAHREAAAALAPFAAAGATNDAVVALRQVAGAYDTLRAAGERRNRARFIAAREAVRRTEATLAGALAALRR
jgi:hypothetical protein